jgi:hypothetical protein
VKKRAALLLALGLLQMGGDLLGVPFLRNLGKASAAAPAPKVFCAVDGYEAYATQFFLEWTDGAGAVQSLPLTIDRVDRLRGTSTARRSRTARSCPGGSARRCSPTA